MAPIAPSNTQRLWVHQQGISGEHNILFRGPVATAKLDLIETVRGILTEWADLLYDDCAWDSARYAEKGSNLSFPVDWVPIPGTNSQTFDPQRKPYFIDFVGRGAGGHRVRWSIQGSVFIGDNSYRIMATENPGVASDIDALRLGAVDLCDIQGAAVNVYPYVDVGYNAYFQRKQRRTG